MTLKIYGSPYSPCNKRVLLVCEEKNIPYEVTTLDFAVGEQKSPEYVKLMPFGKVPTIDEDGFILYESRAIVKYLSLKYKTQGTDLMPDLSDLKEYALFEKACSFETSYFDAPVAALAFEKIFKGLQGLGEPDEAVLAKNVAVLDHVLSVYDGILATQSYLAGDKFTLADLNHLPYANLVRGAGFKHLWEKYPNVEKWWDAMEKRESFKKVFG